MELVPVNKNDLERYNFKKCKNLMILEEFMNSGFDCCEVKNFTQKNARSCANSLIESIRRFKKYGIQVVQRKDRVFLIRTDI